MGINPIGALHGAASTATWRMQRWATPTPPRWGGRDVQLVHPGTVCGSFETPGLMPDKGHSLRHRMGQLLLGQLEARFSLLR